MEKDYLKKLNIPSTPGVYLFRCKNTTLYIGKAKNLKKRISQYFLKNVNPKTKSLTSSANDIQFIKVKSEADALLLECQLIKKYKPKYNVLLKDDKSYPMLKIEMQHEYPGIYYYRGKVDTKNKYFGPYSNIRNLNQIKDEIQHIFKIRTCENSYFKNRSRPCLLYQIDRCSAPCVRKINKDEYHTLVSDAVKMLSGKSDKVILNMQLRMQEFSLTQQYEKAAITRDQIFRLQSIQDRENKNHNDNIYDIFYIKFTFPDVICCHLKVCNSSINSKDIYYAKSHINENIEDITASIIIQYFNSNNHIPNEIITNMKSIDKNILSESLKNMFNKKIKIIFQPKTEKLSWLNLAKFNCEHHEAENIVLDKEMMSILDLINEPRQMECFDISHTSGVATIGACVVFKDYKPVRSLYRYYNIKTKIASDDYEAIRIAIIKRYSDLKKSSKDLPQLVIIDGGKGQLNAAKKALQELQLQDDITLISIAKGEKRKEGLETIFKTDMSELDIHKDHTCFKLLLHIRNEAHNFAIQKHKKARSKKSFKSNLDDIYGIGPKKKIGLLKKFSSIESIKNASIDDLIAIKGINYNNAIAIKDHFNKK